MLNNLKSSCVSLIGFSALIVILSSHIPPVYAQPSFSCDGDLKPLEKLICNDDGLSSLDRQLMTIYRAVLKKESDPSHLKTEQRAWLKQRNSCSDVVCLAHAYEMRIAELQQMANGGQSTAVAATAEPSTPSDGTAKGDLQLGVDEGGAAAVPKANDSSSPNSNDQDTRKAEDDTHKKGSGTYIGDLVKKATAELDKEANIQFNQWLPTQEPDQQKISAYLFKKVWQLFGILKEQQDNLVYLLETSQVEKWMAYDEESKAKLRDFFSSIKTDIPDKSSRHFAVRWMLDYLANRNFPNFADYVDIHVRASALYFLSDSDPLFEVPAKQLQMCAPQYGIRIISLGEATSENIFAQSYMQCRDIARAAILDKWPRYYDEQEVRRNFPQSLLADISKRNTVLERIDSYDKSKANDPNQFYSQEDLNKLTDSRLRDVAGITERELGGGDYDLVVNSVAYAIRKLQTELVAKGYAEPFATRLGAARDKCLEVFSALQNMKQTGNYSMENGVGYWHTCADTAVNMYYSGN